MHGRKFHPIESLNHIYMGGFSLTFSLNITSLQLPKKIEQGFRKSLNKLSVCTFLKEIAWLLPFSSVKKILAIFDMGSRQYSFIGAILAGILMFHFHGFVHSEKGTCVLVYILFSLSDTVNRDIHLYNFS